jgi:DNA-binding MarR family transcriptional regulator
LSHGLLSALSTIDKHGPLRLAELAQVESVSAPSATRLVSELESKGLVTRETDPADGRAILIRTTSTGSTAVVDEKSARTAVITELLEQLEPHELEAVASALAALEGVMNNGNNNTGAHPSG